MATYSDLTLETPRLRLRPYAPSDAADVFAMFSDPEVMRYWSSAPWTDLQQAHDFLARDAASIAEGTSARLGIVRKEDGALIGNCTLFSFDRQCRRAETGYVLSRAAWGHGYANEAVAALLDWGFETLDLNRVEADIDPRNAPSARALERLGFVREGHLRERWIVNGEVTRLVHLRPAARQWKARTMTQSGVLRDRPHLWAFVVGCIAVTAGVVMHLPMFWMGRFNHFHLADMPMDGGMMAGMALIVGGIVVAGYGLLPRRTRAAGRTRARCCRSPRPRTRRWARRTGA